MASPLTNEMLSDLGPACRIVQFKSLLTDEDFCRVARLLSRYPEVTLRAYGSYDGSISDLEFLRFFPTLLHFSADALRYQPFDSFDGLRHLPVELESLVLGQTRRRLSLDVLGRFRHLRRLYLEAQTKGIAVIGGMTSITDLTLRSITLPNLALLRPLTNLRVLDLKLGGTKDLTLLPEVGRIEYLELWMVRGLADLSAVGHLPYLRYLFLQALRNVERLPDLDDLRSLKGVRLETMKGLRDLSPLCDAPVLEQLELVDMGHLQVADLTCLVGHPTLKQALLGLGSKKKNDEARALLGLPRSNGFPNRGRPE